MVGIGGTDGNRWVVGIRALIGGRNRGTGGNRWMVGIGH